MGTTNIADIRRDYKLQSLLETDVANDPVSQFGKWWNEAINSKIDEVNAMTLATCTKQGFPSARIVLLKGYTNEGFIFYTNYQSHKGREIEQNPNVSLVFFWKELERQVRIEGTTGKISEEESNAYFSSRPEGSKIGAWASPQSRPIADRQWIEESYLKYSEQFKETEIRRPPHWGGYIVKPNIVEFWQGRSSRLHDRLQYTKQQNGWKIERLAP
jgi:pyridoxamine 5'-phosphate oxidase